MNMAFAPIRADARDLFLRYAAPCGETLVKRKTLDARELAAWIRALKEGTPVPRKAEDAFRVARAHLTVMAADAGKPTVDASLVRKYFLSEHDDVVDYRSREMGDFDPDGCRTRLGRVVSAGPTRVVLVVEGKRRAYQSPFLADLRKGDWVVTHWNVVVERASKPVRARLRVAEKKRTKAGTARS